MKNTNKKIRVVFYARVSTEHDAQVSAFDNQLDWYKDLLLRHPEWDCINTYTDKGVTGTSAEKRPGFILMYADALAGKFDKIVTREVSRFARNTRQALEYAEKFHDCGVTILFVNDNIDTQNGEDMTIRFSLMAALAEEESRRDSERAKAGQHTSMQNGVYFGNGNILGYDRYESRAPGEAKKIWFEINEEQAETVRMIFDMYLNGMGLSLIKDELERRGRRTAQGMTKWFESNISKILQNSFYYGVLTYHKEYVASYKDDKRIKNRGELEQITAKGSHKPIVTEEEFDRVQAMLNARREENEKRSVGRKPMADQWGPLLKCACGHGFSRTHYSGSGENRNVAYQCAEVKSHGSHKSRTAKGLPVEGFCDAPMVQQWKLDFMARELFASFIPNKNEVVELALQMVNNYLQENHSEDAYENNIRQTQARLDSLDVQLSNARKYLVSGILDEMEFQKIRSELNDELEKAKAELDALQAEWALNGAQDAMQKRISNLRALLNRYVDCDVSGTQIPDTVVSGFVKAIVVYEDHFEWYLRTDGSDVPIVCNVQGRSNGKKTFIPPTEVSPIGLPPHRLLFAKCSNQPNL